MNISYATFNQRVLSRLIDFALFFCLELLLVKLTNIRDTDIYAIYNSIAESGWLNNNIFRTDQIRELSFFVFFFIYTPLMAVNGGTIGQRIIKIEPIAESTLKSPTFWQMFYRGICIAWPVLIIYLLLRTDRAYIDGTPTTFTQVLLGFLVFSIFFLPAITIWGNSKRQAFHDKLSKIVIIQKKNMPSSNT
jgi:hypothetical protein